MSSLASRLRRLAPVALLVSLGVVLFLVGLGERDLNSSHEARAAQNAQTILSDGDWLLPHLYDRHAELQKPPLYYWLVALIASLRGGVVDQSRRHQPARLATERVGDAAIWLALRAGRPVAAAQWDHRHGDRRGGLLERGRHGRHRYAVATGHRSNDSLAGL